MKLARERDAVGPKAAMGAVTGARRGALGRCKASCKRLKLWMCRRHVVVGDIEDTDASSTETASTEDSLEEWYEQRDFDSYFFPLSMFRDRGHEDDTSSSECCTDSLSLLSSFPRQASPGQSHCWGDADWSSVKVRSAGYLQSRRKEPSKAPMLELVDVDLFTSTQEVLAASAGPPSVGCGISRARTRGDDRFLFIVNFRMGAAQLVVTWALPSCGPCKTEPAGVLLERFLGLGMGDDERHDRLKLLPLLIEGPLLLRSAMPPKPAILSRQCTTVYYRGDNCLEASVDCAGASFGKKLTKLLRGGGCVLSMFAIIEGQAEEELPERLLGGVALFNVDIDRATPR